LGHNFDSRYASKPVKGSYYSDDNLDSKKLQPKKITCWIGTQDHATSVIKS